MKTFLYIVRIIIQTLVIGFLLYFFNTDAHWNFRPTLDWFNVWLSFSFVSQFYIMKAENVMTTYSSLVTQGLKNMQIADSHAYQSQHNLERYLHGVKGSLKM